MQALRERAGQPQGIHVARWMVAHTLRLLGRHDEALAIQTDLARRGDATGQPDHHVFDELALLAQARGDAAEAARWAERRDQARPR
jgi:hypothetical protein